MKKNKEASDSALVKELKKSLSNCSKAGIMIRILLNDPEIYSQYKSNPDHYYALRIVYPETKQLFFPKDFQKTAEQYKELFKEMKLNIDEKRLPALKKTRAYNHKNEIYTNNKAPYISEDDYYDVKSKLRHIIHIEKLKTDRPVRSGTKGDIPKLGIKLANIPIVFYALYTAFSEAKELHIFMNSQYYERNKFMLEVGKNEIEMKWFVPTYRPKETHIIHEQQGLNYDMNQYYELFNPLISMYFDDPELFLRLKDHFIGVFRNKTLDKDISKRTKVAFWILQLGILTSKYIETFKEFEKNTADKELEQKVHRIASDIHRRQIYLDGIFSNEKIKIKDKTLMKQINKLGEIDRKILQKNIGIIKKIEEGLAENDKKNQNKKNNKF